MRSKCYTFAYFIAIATSTFAFAQESHKEKLQKAQIEVKDAYIYGVEVVRMCANGTVDFDGTIYFADRSEKCAQLRKLIIQLRSRTR